MCKSLDHEIHLFWLELRFPIMCEPLAFSILLSSLALFFCVCVSWSLSVVLVRVRVLLGLALLLPHCGPRAAARVLRPLVHVLSSKRSLARVFVGGVGTLTRSDCATKPRPNKHSCEHTFLTEHCRLAPFQQLPYKSSERTRKVLDTHTTHINNSVSGLSLTHALSSKRSFSCRFKMSKSQQIENSNG